MKIGVVGCLHGELDRVYETIEQQSVKIDLLLICGDFEATRCPQDLVSMAGPVKYRRMGDFHKYYEGKAVASVPTIFVGGNHEASNYLQELPYGGWIAPNIYYMGLASVINFGGLRIGGISGIFKSHDYKYGHYENVPYDPNTMRSVYHYRSMEVARLNQLRPAELDIFLSHDWPNDVTDYGDKDRLLQYKPQFAEGIRRGTLGSWPLSKLLHSIRPKHWFAGHMHCKFEASIAHTDSMKTEFLALSKVLPGQEHFYFQVLDIASPAPEKPKRIHIDPEWCAIMKLTDHLWSYDKKYTYIPSEAFAPSDEEIQSVIADFGAADEVAIPANFERAENINFSRLGLNSQTQLIADVLHIRYPNEFYVALSKGMQNPHCPRKSVRENVRGGSGFLSAASR